MLSILFTLLLIGLVPLLLVLQRRFSRLRNIGGGLMISYLTIVLLLGMGEIYFRYLHAAPEGILARENWMARYWQTNALGFRDRKWLPEEWAGKKTVLIVGDSFTAGWGVENPADRFSDMLAQQLGDSYAVLNLGVPGSATRSQLRTLKNHPVQKPDVVILQYFLNDIEDAALSIGQFQQFPQTPPWIRESYLANYLYSLQDSGFGEGYWTWEYEKYDNSGIWQIHQREIEDFIDYTESIGARLIVVIFPNMQDPFHSIPYVDRVAQVFEARGENNILKLFDAVASWDPATVIVSPRDAHPSAAFHHYVGEELFRLFFESGDDGNG